MNQFQDVFISYGRADSKDFAKKLNDRLIAQGLEVWFDFDDIPLGVDYQNQIDDGIEKADNFLFIIAPHSVNSPYCGKEVELALKRHKRIIPILHVEQISRETWQTRNPNGTDEEWQAYTAQGKHSSFPNMHPEIGKINWVYLRENIDDFDKGFQGLLDILGRQKIYVYQHTQLLAKALEWERNRKQSQYLLTGEERQQAEEWLKIRFKEEQAPCTPSDLHCEYITESIKNANNLMTQVFISYADEDRETMQKIRNSLRRESITVWTNKTDIQTGESFEEAIKRGIEQADNIVFLLSPESLKSAYCQQELRLAITLNKRIIPLLGKAVDLEQVPEQLRYLQYIDLTDNVKEDDYLLDESQLLKIIHEDAAYYNEHKILLTKALKWQQQNKNPSILLRGYNLRSAEAWMKVAKTRTQHPPTALQEEFIAESLNQPPLESLDVFISYSRSDSDFARKLNDTLQMQGKTTWFDQESIASGSDFQQEIYRGIKACDNFLFVLSPRSIHSPYCADEVEYAASLNKRFVTLLHQPIATDGLHPELAKVQWIDFSSSQQDFNAYFNQLVRTLDTDREHVQSHTKWLQRSLEWEQKAKSADLLLRGSELAIAQNWLKETEQQQKQPAATDLQKQYISDSQKATDAEIKREKQQKIILKAMLGLMSTAFIAAVGVSILAFREKQQAQKNLAAQVTALSRYSKTLTSTNQEFDALIEGIRAGKSLLEQRQNQLSLWRKAISQPEKDVEIALKKALYQVKELNRVEKQSFIRISSNNQLVATLAKDGTAKLLNFQGQEQATLNHGDEKISAIAFTQKGDQIFTISAEKDQATLQLWDSQGNPIQSFDPIEKFEDFYVAPNHQVIVTYRWKGEEIIINIWRIEGKKLIPILSDEPFNDVALSSDGEKIYTVREENSQQIIQVWDKQGQLLQTFNPIESFKYLFLQANDQVLVTVSEQDDARTVKAWQVNGQKLNSIFSGKSFSDVEVSQDGNRIVTISNEEDPQIQLWDKQGKLLQSVKVVGSFNDLTFSPDFQFIYTQITQDDQSSYKIWKVVDQKLIPLLPSARIRDLSFNQNDTLIATMNQENLIQIWTKNGEELQRFSPGISLDYLYLGAEGQTIVTGSFDQVLSFWDIEQRDRRALEGQMAQVINDGENVVALEGSPDQYTTLKIWDLKQQKKRSFSFNNPFKQIYFNHDGKLAVVGYQEESQLPIQLWSLTDQKPQRLLGDEPFSLFDFSQDGNEIVTATEIENKENIKIWDSQGKLLQSFEPVEEFDDLSFLPNEQLIYSYRKVGDSQIGKLWKIEGQKLVPLLAQEKLTTLTFSRDGKLLVTESADESNQTFKVWKWENGKIIRLLAEEEFNKAVLSPEGNWIATFADSQSVNRNGANRRRSNQPIIKLWAVKRPEILILPITEEIHDLQFSEDGQFIATFNEKNRAVQVWKQTGRKLELMIEEVRVNDFSSNVSFARDGSLLATVNSKNLIQIWNSEGQEVASLNLNQTIEKISFSPDGKTLTLLRENKAPIVWSLKWQEFSTLNLESLMQKACQRVGNYLKNKTSDDRTLCDNVISDPTPQN